MLPRNRESQDERETAGIFAAGLIVMLLLPAFFAVYFMMRCCQRSRMNQHRRLLSELPVAEELMGPGDMLADESFSSDGEEEALRPKKAVKSKKVTSGAARSLYSKMQKHSSGGLHVEQSSSGMMPVHFRKSGWRVKSSPKIASEVALEEVCSLQV